MKPALTRAAMREVYSRSRAHQTAAGSIPRPTSTRYTQTAHDYDLELHLRLALGVVTECCRSGAGADRTGSADVSQRCRSGDNPGIGPRPARTAVSGLTPGDFEVRDNGQLRPILSLRSDRQSPVSLAILVDMSGSMRIGSKIAMARQAFDSILSQLRDGRGRSRAVHVRLRRSTSGRISRAISPRCKGALVRVRALRHDLSV